MAYASVNDLEDLKDKSEDYLKYWEKKEEIKKKYSEDCFPNWVPDGRKFITHSTTKEQRQEYKQYLKEIGDLLFEPNGDYQNFVWNQLMPPGEREIQERIARGRLPRNFEY